MTTNRRSAQLLVATRKALTDTVERHMPAGAYRDFTIWACSPKNPKQLDFLQAAGVLQLVNMNTTLLSGLVEEAAWPRMLDYTGRMNAYQILEVISDNLAIGLGNTGLDERDRLRRGLVSTFNRTMVETLIPGRRRPAVLLLAGPARAAARQTSGFQHSLAPRKHAGIAEEYVKSIAAQGKDAPAPEELEFGLWPALVANVEACHELVDEMAGSATASLLRQRLMDRYRAIDRTLHAQHLSRPELASLGAQSILAAPMLAFLLGVLAERVQQIIGYREAVAAGWLGDVLTDAALLVRLLNDIGTRLLCMPAVRQAAALHRLGGHGEQGGLELLRDQGGDPVFARLHKDLTTGESNIALWHARRATDPGDAWRALAESVAYYGGLYTQHRTRLLANLAQLDDLLGGDRRASCMIERFVRFHERMYSHPHTEPAGEYAI